MDILPRWVGMIKTELFGREYGGDLGGSGFLVQTMVYTEIRYLHR
jgi:hypothetical protein